MMKSDINKSEIIRSGPKVGAKIGARPKTMVKNGKLVMNK